MGLAAEAARAAIAMTASSSAVNLGSASGARALFQWGGTISALFLLIMNRTGRKSPTQTTILVLYLFSSFPTALFKILRGQFGCWVAFLAVAANLFFPQTFPVARFVLFVITPDWVANGLRDSIVGGVFCLILGAILVIAEIRAVGGLMNCSCSWRCFLYWVGVGLLFLFTMFYLIWETW